MHAEKDHKTENHHGKSHRALLKTSTRQTDDPAYHFSGNARNAGPMRHRGPAAIPAGSLDLPVPLD